VPAPRASASLTGAPSPCGQRPPRWARGGRQLNSGDTWSPQHPCRHELRQDMGTHARAAASFSGNSGRCATGRGLAAAAPCPAPCPGMQPPLTLAEFTLDRWRHGRTHRRGAAVPRLWLPAPTRTYHQPNAVKTKACSGNMSFSVVFCP
jgi:hypothetical protein